jgi:hypothetical protein
MKHIVNSPETSRSSRLVIFHHHTINDFPIATEVALQRVLCRLPAESTHEKFPIYMIFDDVERKKKTEGKSAFKIIILYTLFRFCDDHKNVTSSKSSQEEL